MTFKLILVMLLSWFSVGSAQQVAEVVWTTRINPSSDWNEPAAMSLDSSGNIYVTGRCGGGGGSPHDYATAKYYPSGDTAWVRVYDGPLHVDDEACAVAVDDSGYCYVAGSTDGYMKVGLPYDYGLLKYSPSGDLAWLKRYSGPSDGTDWAYDMARDPFGNLLVSGESELDFATVKYGPEGDTLWVRRYSGSQGYLDQARAVAFDAEANIYVTGKSVSALTDADFVTIKYSAAGEQLWLRSLAGPGASKDVPQALVVDALGNAYVVGESNAAFMAVKYDPAGDTLWVRCYDEPGSDIPVAVALDDQGNLVVTGRSSLNASIPEDFDIATIKYAPDGEEVWVRRYSGISGGQDSPSGVAVDGEGAVYVVGQRDRRATYPFDPDILLLKYDAAGNLIWTQEYGGVDGGWDQGEAICLDDSAYVYVAGSSEGGSSYSDFVVIKYRQEACFCGDADGSSILNIVDAAYLIGYVFGSGPAPSPLCLGDADGDCQITVADAVFIIAFIFTDGPPPACSGSPCDWR